MMRCVSAARAAGTGARLSGGRKMPPRRRYRGVDQGRADGQAQKNAEPILQAPQSVPLGLMIRPLRSSLLAWTGSSAGGLGAAFFAAFAFSFAANSCLTFAEMASVSTL